MMKVKPKLTIKQKIEEVEEKMLETESVELMNYYRGIIYGLKYALDYASGYTVEFEEIIEI